uniref:Uncharacterized protein n=1 Tax=Aquila chrysaetos chrysaetos TaxID=223781 RepID=A0A663EQW8_AQUCH
MEKEKPFKLFVPPRLSGGQVSAVKPQTSTRTTGTCYWEVHLLIPLLALIYWSHQTKRAVQTFCRYALGYVNSITYFFLLRLLVKYV